MTCHKKKNIRRAEPTQEEIDVETKNLELATIRSLGTETHAQEKPQTEIIGGSWKPPTPEQLIEKLVQLDQEGRIFERKKYVGLSLRYTGIALMTMQQLISQISYPQSFDGYQDEEWFKNFLDTYKEFLPVRRIKLSGSKDAPNT